MTWDTLTDNEFMPKTITKLKRKHRNRIWKDSFGELWYFNPIHQDWDMLVSTTYGNSRESEGFIPAAHQIDQAGAKPFTAVATAVFHEDHE